MRGKEREGEGRERESGIRGPQAGRCHGPSTGKNAPEGRGKN